MQWYEKLYVARRNKDMSQRELAKLSKTNHVQISRIEQGVQMPKIDMFFRICKNLDISMDYVFKDFDKFDFKVEGKSE